jgi:hypothetical protein
MIQTPAFASVYIAVDFSELTDVIGRRVYGMPTEGIGRLLIWDVAPLLEWPHTVLWFAVVLPEGEPIQVPEDEDVYRAVHDRLPKEPGG